MEVAEDSVLEANEFPTSTMGGNKPVGVVPGESLWVPPGASSCKAHGSSSSSHSWAKCSELRNTVESYIEEVS